MVSEGLKGMVSLKINTEPYKAEVRQFQGYVETVEKYWQRVRYKVRVGVNKAVATIRKVSRLVGLTLESIGLSLSPVQQALVDAAFAVVAWILSIEAAISTGTLGMGTVIAAAAGATAIAISIQAAFAVEQAMAEHRSAIQREADILTTLLDIPGIIWW